MLRREVGFCGGYMREVLIGVTTIGFRASMGTLDSYAGKLPTDGPVVIITASFEGSCLPHPQIYIPV